MAKEEESVGTIARRLADELWTEAFQYLSALAYRPTRIEDPERLAVWLAAVVAQGIGPGELLEFQLPEPFAGFGGEVTSPRLLLVGLNPGFARDQFFPRWQWHHDVNGQDTYFNFFWRGFSRQNRKGGRESGSPLKWNRIRTQSKPIPHYEGLEAVLGAGSLGSTIWQVDALPWKSTAGVRLYKRRNDFGNGQGGLAIERAFAVDVAQERVKTALSAVAPIGAGEPARHVLVLGQTAAELLGASWAARDQGWQNAVGAWADGLGSVKIFVASHPHAYGKRWLVTKKALVAHVLPRLSWPIAPSARPRKRRSKGG